MTALTLFGQQSVECRSCRRILFTDRFGRITRHFTANRPGERLWCIRSDQIAEGGEIR